MEVKIISESILSDELKSYLEHTPSWEKSQTKLELRPTSIRLRGTDPTILVAIVGAVGGTVSALVTALLSIARKRQIGKIVIHSKEGSRLEVPANISMAKIDELIVKVKAMDVGIIEI